VHTSSTPPTPLEPAAVSWAFDVEHLQAVLVVEVGYLMDAAPGLHLALPVVVPGTAERVLADNGWSARSWWPRTWGRLARVDQPPVSPSPAAVSHR
jgi:hypothetical protein